MRLKRHRDAEARRKAKASLFYALALMTPWGRVNFLYDVLMDLADGRGGTGEHRGVFKAAAETLLNEQWPTKDPE